MNKWEALRYVIKELYINNKDKPDVENVTTYLLKLMLALEERERKEEVIADLEPDKGFEGE